MAFDIGIDFRQTAGYVTDPAGCTYSLDETYPITRGGATFGWVTAVGGNGRDRNSAIDPRLAGICYRNDNSSTKATFRLDLPASGAVDIYCAIGDVANRGYLEIFDSTTSLGVLVADHASSSSYLDATNTAYSAANWPGSNAKTTLTFATTTLLAKITPGTSSFNNYVINHLRAVKGSSGITLVGSNSTEGNIGGSGSVDQSHAVSGANGSQGNAASVAAITQSHVLAGANASQANTSITGGLIQENVLSGAASAQANDSASGAVTQGAAFTGASSDQSNASGTGPVNQTHALSGSAAVQDSASSALAITQVHVLAASGTAQANAGSTGAITLGAANNLAAAASAQANSSNTASIAQAHILVHAPSVQDNVAAASAIVQAYILAAENCGQANLCSAGAIAQTSGIPPVDGPAGSGPRLRIASGHRPAMRNTSRPGQLR